MFATWFADARKSVRPLPHAMALATTGPGGRASVRMVLHEELRCRRLRVLYQLQEPQGARSREERPREPALLLGRSRAPGAYRGQGSEGHAARVGRVLRHALARQPARRVGLAAERDDRRPRGARPALRRRGRPLPRAWCRARSTGEVTGSHPRRSSSGRDARTGCTIASSTASRATAGGCARGSRPERFSDDDCCPGDRRVGATRTRAPRSTCCRGWRCPRHCSPARSSWCTSATRCRFRWRSERTWRLYRAGGRGCDRARVPPRPRAVRPSHHGSSPTPRSRPGCAGARSTPVARAVYLRAHDLRAGEPRSARRAARAGHDQPERRRAARRDRSPRRPSSA